MHADAPSCVYTRPHKLTGVPLHTDSAHLSDSLQRFWDQRSSYMCLAITAPAAILPRKDILFYTFYTAQKAFSLSVEASGTNSGPEDWV